MWEIYIHMYTGNERCVRIKCSELSVREQTCVWASKHVCACVHVCMQEREENVQFNWKIATKKKKKSERKPTVVWNVCMVVFECQTHIRTHRYANTKCVLALASQRSHLYFMLVKMSKGYMFFICSRFSHRHTIQIEWIPKVGRYQKRLLFFLNKIKFFFVFFFRIKFFSSMKKKFFFEQIGFFQLKNSFENVSWNGTQFGLNNLSVCKLYIYKLTG